MANKLIFLIGLAVIAGWMIARPPRIEVRFKLPDRGETAVDEA